VVTGISVEKLTILNKILDKSPGLEPRSPRPLHGYVDSPNLIASGKA